jgi:hypothetical protein
MGTYVIYEEAQMTDLSGARETNTLSSGAGRLQQASTYPSRQQGWDHESETVQELRPLHREADLSGMHSNVVDDGGGQTEGTGKGGEVAEGRVSTGVSKEVDQRFGDDVAAAAGVHVQYLCHTCDVLQFTG